MKTIAQRIAEGMAIRGMKQIDIIEKTGINKGALSSYISGKYQPKQTNIYLIANALDVSEAWLMGYDVPMEKSEQTIETKLTSSEQDHIDKYRSIDDKGKHTVDTVLDMEYSRCSNIIPFKESEKKKYEPTEDDIKSLVARNGKKLSRHEAIDLISTLFSDDEDEE